MGRHPIHPGLALFMASASPVRRATMQPLVAHSSTTTVRRICARSRFGNAANDGSVVGEDPWKLDGSRNGKAHHHPPNENGRPRFEVSREDSGRRLLGLMG